MVRLFYQVFGLSQEPLLQPLFLAFADGEVMTGW